VLIQSKGFYMKIAIHIWLPKSRDSPVWHPARGEKDEAVVDRLDVKEPVPGGVEAQLPPITLPPAWVEVDYGRQPPSVHALITVHVHRKGASTPCNDDVPAPDTLEPRLRKDNEGMGLFGVLIMGP